MKKSLAFLVCLVVVSVSAGLMAQYGPGSGFHPGQGGGKGAGLYDPATVQTISGEVASVDKIEGKRPGVYGLRISVNGHEKKYDVWLGPSFFLDEAGLQVAMGDKVTVTGSLVTVKGQQVILAASITKGGKTVKLRDDLGRPLWRQGAKRPWGQGAAE